MPRQWQRFCIASCTPIFFLTLFSLLCGFSAADFSLVPQSATLFGGKSPTAIVPLVLLGNEGDPRSNLPSSVNVISGSFFVDEDDIVVSGPDSIAIRRTYDSATFEAASKASVTRSWQINNERQLFAYKVNPRYPNTFYIGRPINVFVGESSGSMVNFTRPFPVGDSEPPLTCTSIGSGVTNSASGVISGQTNLRNHKLSFSDISRRATVVTGSAGTRSYELIIPRCGYKMGDRERAAKAFAEDPIATFVLKSETRPNGNKVFYTYLGGMGVLEIKLTNASQSKILGWIHLDTSRAKSTFMTSSDGQRVVYQLGIHRDLSSYIELIGPVNASSKPATIYNYNCHQEENFLYLTNITAPNGRYLYTDYYVSGANNVGGTVVTVTQKQNAISLHRVKTQSAPVGVDKTPVITSRFFYFYAQDASKNQLAGHTDVYDAGNNLTRYHVSTLQRITATERFSKTAAGTCLPYSVERQVWGEGVEASSLLGKSWEDGNGKVLSCHTFSYDTRGNVLQEKLYGQLTGAGAQTIALGKNGLPLENDAKENGAKENGSECYVKSYTYSNDGFNLVLSETDGKKSVKCVYKPGTNLLVGKWILDGETIRQRTFHEYDDNASVSKTIVDDGRAFDQDDLQGVSERHITRITGKQHMPAIGLPEQVEEFVLDLDTGKERLIKRIVNTYCIQGWVTRQDVYGEGNQYAYSLESQYDAMGHIISQKNALGQVTTAAYDANGNKTSEAFLGTGLNLRVDYTYDFSNRLIKKMESSGGETRIESFRYNTLSQKIASVDSFGNETRYEYDSPGRVSKVISPALLNDAELSVVPIITKEYDIFGRETVTVDGDGYPIQTRYNIRGKPIEIIYPDGTSETFLYTLDGTLCQAKSKTGTITRYTTDYAGRTTRIETFAPSGTCLGVSESRYNAFHILSSVDGSGITTTYTYDAAGRQASVSKDRSLTTCHYDFLGRSSETRSWFGDGPYDYTASVEVLDLLNRVIEKRAEQASENGRVILYREHTEYDALGNRIATTTYPQNKPARSTTVYDSFSRPIKSTDGMGNSTFIHYNTQFVNSRQQTVLRKTITDAMGNLTVLTHDTSGRVETVIKKAPTGTVVLDHTFRYDCRGNRTRLVENIIGHTSYERICTWTYGPMNRLERSDEAVYAPETRSTSYRYNAYGQQEAVVKSNGVALLHTYDEWARLSTLSASDSSLAYTYHYDLNHNITAVTEGARATLRTYDSFNRLTQETLSNGLSLESHYDRQGRRTALTLPDKSAVGYGYNGAFLTRVARLSKTGEEAYAHTYDQYDLAGNLERVSLIGGTGIIEYARDLLGRPAKITAPEFTETITQDALGNMKSRAISDGTENALSYEYDALNRITSESGHSYTYDSAGNRLTKDGRSYSVNALNQVVDDGMASYAYDLNGNLIKKSIRGKRSESVTTYEYDALDRMIHVTELGVSRTTFIYDAFNRRVAKETFGWSGWRAWFGGSGSWTLKRKTLFIYDGQAEIGATDTSGLITELRILGSGLGAEIGAAVAMEFQGKVCLPIHDSRGNVVALHAVKNNTLTKIESYSYTAFGEEQIRDKRGKTLVNSSVGNSWRYASKRTDIETGWVYFGRRYYSPDLGKWTTMDPKGFVDGPNLYAYVCGNPLSLLDLYGLASFRDRVSSFLGGAQHFFKSLFSLPGRALSFIGRHCIPLPGLREGVIALGNCLAGSPALATREKTSQHVLGNGTVGDRAALTGVNGILNDTEDCLSSGQLTSEAFNGMAINTLCYPSKGFALDMTLALITKGPVYAQVSHDLAKMWNGVFGRLAPDGRIVHIAHSNGGTITYNALKLMSKTLAKRIDVRTFGSATLIPEGLAGTIKNVVDRMDLVPMVGDPIRYCQALAGKNPTVEFVGDGRGLPFSSHAFSSNSYQKALKGFGDDFVEKYGVPR